MRRGDHGVPQDSVSPLPIGKWGQMHFWVLEAVPPPLLPSTMPLRGDSPALTPVGFQTSCQEALP